jgi:hypothetical protein
VQQLSATDTARFYRQKKEREEQDKQQWERDARAQASAKKKEKEKAKREQAKKQKDEERRVQRETVIAPLRNHKIAVGSAVSRGPDWPFYAGEEDYPLVGKVARICPREQGSGYGFSKRTHELFYGGEEWARNDDDDDDTWYTKRGKPGKKSSGDNPRAANMDDANVEIDGIIVHVDWWVGEQQETMRLEFDQEDEDEQYLACADGGTFTPRMVCSGDLGHGLPVEFYEQFELQIGSKVTWTDSDDDIPPGALGVITSAERDGPGRQIGWNVKFASSSQPNTEWGLDACDLRDEATGLLGSPACCIRCEDVEEDHRPSSLCKRCSKQSDQHRMKGGTMRCSDEFSIILLSMPPPPHSSFLHSSFPSLFQPEVIRLLG